MKTAARISLQPFIDKRIMGLSCHAAERPQ
jgi:hypothetical protein